jgi:hypothetical protein
MAVEDGPNCLMMLAVALISLSRADSLLSIEKCKIEISCSRGGKVMKKCNAATSCTNDGYAAIG